MFNRNKEVYAPLKAIEESKVIAKKYLGRHDFRKVIDIFFCGEEWVAKQQFRENPWLDKMYHQISKESENEANTREEIYSIFNQKMCWVIISGIVNEWAKTKKTYYFDSDTFEKVSKIEANEEWIELLPEEEPFLIDVCERSESDDSRVPHFFIVYKYENTIYNIVFWYDREKKGVGIGFEPFRYNRVKPDSYLYKNLSIAAAIFNGTVNVENNTEETVVDLWDCKLNDDTFSIPK